MNLDIVYKVKELINENKTHKDIGNILSLTRSQVNYACNFDVEAYITKMNRKQEEEQYICELYKKHNNINKICSIINKKATNTNYDFIRRILSKNGFDCDFKNTMQSSKLRKRLLKEGIKDYKCEICGNREWNGKPIPLQLHHINGDKSDNRKSNLRFSNDLLNSHNRSTPSNNTSGCMGVSFHTKSNKWRATITVNHKHIELGEFKNIEDAIEARNIAELKYFKGSH